MSIVRFEISMSLDDYVTAQASGPKNRWATGVGSCTNGPSGATQVRLLDAAELNIGLDGSLDYDLEFLRDFDLSVASVHSHMDRDARQTDRILAAIAHPAVDVIGHPTGGSSGIAPTTASSWRRSPRPAPRPAPRGGQRLAAAPGPVGRDGPLVTNLGQS